MHARVTTANLAGVAPHYGRTGNIQAASLKAAGLGASGLKGEKCMFSWFFEIDSNGSLLKSPTSDTVGFCSDQSNYKYDSYGAFDTTWPKCDMIGLGSNGYGVQNGLDAAQFACVSTTTGGIVFGGKGAPWAHLDLRVPYQLVEAL